MSEAVIVSACRTAIGTARKGTLVDSDPFALARHVVEEALSRSQLDPEIIDDVILGESLAGGGDIARYAAIGAQTMYLQVHDLTDLDHLSDLAELIPLVG